MLSNYLTSFSWKNLRLVIYLLWSYIPQVYFEWHFFLKWTGQFKVVFGNLVILPSDYHYNCPNIMGLECNGCCTWWFHLQDINVLLAVSSVFYLLMRRKSNRKPKRISEWAENTGIYITYSPQYQTLYLDFKFLCKVIKFVNSQW